MIDTVPVCINPGFPSRWVVLVYPEGYRRRVCLECLTTPLEKVLARVDRFKCSTPECELMVTDYRGYCADCRRERRESDIQEVRLSEVRGRQAKKEPGGAWPGSEKTTN